MFDLLHEQLKTVKFQADNRNYSGRKRINNSDHPQIIHFTLRSPVIWTTKKVSFGQSYGMRTYPELYQTLRDIARVYFPDHTYNWIQVSKNVRTDKHRDKGNRGLSYTFTVGDFVGGDLMTETGAIDVHNRPVQFDGKNTTHWTGEWTGGDRYCVIYFDNPKGDVPKKLRGAVDVLKPERHTDYATINEIFRYDIYRQNDFVRAGEVWVDVGANIGAFLLKCLELGASRVYAYEPCRRNYDKVMDTLGEDSRVELIQKAVSDYDGETELYLDIKGDWRHTIHRKIRGRDSVMVEVIDASTLPECDGMKLDCEGSEVAIVRRLAEKNRLPPKLVMEYDGQHHPKKADYDAFVGLLKSRYQNVIYREIKDDIRFFPNGMNIRCLNPHLNPHLR